MKYLNKYCDNVDKSTLIKQWNAIAYARNNQLRSGCDISFEHILVPSIFQLSSDCDWSLVLDAGCGTGVLSERLAQTADLVVGVDMSSESIAIAKKNILEKNNLHYMESTIEKFSLNSSYSKFSLVIANMLLQDTPDLAATIKAIGELTKKSGHLVLTITHPCFWPKYWDYDKEPWFSYEKEIAIEAPFSISNSNDFIGLTTHFHRPLSQYIAAIIDCGFELVSLIEPMPSIEVQSKYPSPWEFPRFLVLKLIKTK